MSESRRILPSLEIRGYRAISSLRLPALGDVNLFVGKNNVGKTSLLEAIRLYVSGNPATTLASLYRERAPSSAMVVRDAAARSDSEGAGGAVRRLEQFFHGSFSDRSLDPIRIGPAELGTETLVIRAPWASEGTDLWEAALSEGPEVFLTPDSAILEVERNGERREVALGAFLHGFSYALRRERRGVTTFVPATGFDASRISDLWDSVANAGFAEDVEAALRSIVPELERVYLLGEVGTTARSVSVSLRGASRPVPLSSMGDGLHRLFGIVLAIIRSRGDFVLIDEVENGIHYSVQGEVWRSLLALARRFEAQLFATTHSGDTIRAFTAAAVSRPDVAAMMHRLEATPTELRVVEFTEEELGLVTEYGIEVR